MCARMAPTKSTRPVLSEIQRLRLTADQLRLLRMMSDAGTFPSLNHAVRHYLAVGMATDGVSLAEQGML
jgi:hypothetical protein